MTRQITGGTLFSGIGTPELSAPWIEWRWCAEIDPFASAVLKTRFPRVSNLGDVTKAKWDAVEPVDLIVFGSPCQSFSVAGKRAGLDDARGNMALIGLQVVDRLRPRWMVFENVPGLLSSDEWRDFGTFLGLLGQCGYGFAYRVLDAQYCGVPQRRRRVFVVGYLGDWRPPAAVLFEPDCLQGHLAPRREAREEIAGSLSARATAGGGLGTDFDCDGGLIARAIKAGDMGHRHDPTTDNYVVGALPAMDTPRGHGFADFRCNQSVDAGHIIADTVRSHPRPGSNSLGSIAYGGNNTAGPINVATACNAHGGPHGRLDFETETFVTHSLRAEGFDASEDGTGRGTPIIPIQSVQAVREKRQNGIGIGGDGDPQFTLTGRDRHAIAFSIRSDAMREGTALTPSADAEGRVRLRDPGLGIYADLAPTVDTGQAHAIAFDIMGVPAARGAKATDCHTPLRARAPGNSEASTTTVIAFTERTRPDGRNLEYEENLAYSLNNPGEGGRTQERQILDTSMSVRRLTPRECERLQGFPDDFTLIRYGNKPAKDGPRYRALGNAMAVPVIGWILRRVFEFETHPTLSSDVIQPP